MQLYALDKSQSPVSAYAAKKRENYFCLECSGVVRLREGAHRQPHFYHLHPPPSCRQNGKSKTHLNVQLAIQSLLPEGEAALEKPFPKIKRIADVVWEKEKIVFEVQCSPMERDEMLARTLDYRSLGYHAVWILHERSYNRWRMTALEEAIGSIPHYYSNMTPGGEGIIYDQWHYAAGGRRIKTLPKLAIRIEAPLRDAPSDCKAIAFIEKRASSWPLHFDGDLLSLLSEEENSYLKRAELLEKDLKPKRPSLLFRLKMHYEHFFKTLLKSYCK